MVARLYGHSKPTNTINKEKDFYRLYLVCSDNLNNDIRVTGSLLDESQRNFEILVQCVALRAMPASMNDPVLVEDLSWYESDLLEGPGYIWDFSFDGVMYWCNFGNKSPVHLLVEELDKLVFDSGYVLDTKNNINAEFGYYRHSKENLCKIKNLY